MQLRRMLREIPPGRKVSLEISRDGNIQTLAVQLVDRKAMEHDIWDKHRHRCRRHRACRAAARHGHHSDGGDAPVPGGFHMSVFTSTPQRRRAG